MKWKKNAKNSYEGKSDLGPYDFNIRKEGFMWILDIFNSLINDCNRAHIRSLECKSLKEAKLEAETWI